MAVYRKLGKVLEEGASGFLAKKLAIDGKEALIETSDVDWSSLNRIFSSSADSTSFGSNHWASVYLASTPRQAAQLGIKFPGVDEVSCLRLPYILMVYDINDLSTSLCSLRTLLYHLQYSIPYLS